MGNNTAALLTVFIFILIPLILAEVARKKSVPTTEDFFLQSRKMNLPITFFTVYATWVSSFAIIGATSSFFERGPVFMTCFAWNALFAVLFYLAGERVWFFGKTRGYISPVDFFRDVYGSNVLCFLVSIIMLIFTLPYVQIQLASGAIIIEAVTDGLIPWRICGLLFYFVIIIYLWAGGLRAVSMTDVYYGILMFITTIFTGIYLINKAGGIHYVFNKLAVSDPDLLSLRSADGQSDTLLWLCMFIIVPLGAFMGPQIWIRFYAVEKRRTFKIMPFLLAAVTIIYLGPILTAAAAKVLIPDIVNTDFIIPTLLMKYAPMLLYTILICGIASAALSTANSQIHATAVIYTLDFHKKYISPKASEKQLVAVAKWAVLIISVIAYLLHLGNVTVIIETGPIAFGGTSQLIIPAFGGLFWRRSNKNAAIWGLASGIFILILLHLLLDINGYYIAVLALLLNFAIFTIVSLVLSPDKTTKIKIKIMQLEYEKMSKEARC